jgi:hypothetical protein
LPHFAVYRDHLIALGIVPGDSDSATKAFADLNTELDNEKAAQKAAQIEVDTLSWAVQDLKISVDKFAAQIPTVEDKVKYLENMEVDKLNDVRAWELCLEHLTRANSDYKKQNTQLTKKLESKSFGRIRNILSFLNHFLVDPALTHRVGCRAQRPEDDGGQCSCLLLPRRVLLWSVCPQMLDNLPTRSREIILTNMRQAVSLTLKILMSLHPRTDLDAAGEGFTATCSDEEALKLVEDSTVSVGQVVDMFRVDMSLG